MSASVLKERLMLKRNLENPGILFKFESKTLSSNVPVSSMNLTDFSYFLSLLP